MTLNRKSNPEEKKKNKVKGIIFPVLKTTIIKTAWYWQTDIQTNGTEFRVQKQTQCIWTINFQQKSQKHTTERRKSLQQMLGKLGSQMQKN